jgi:hypothetical protein
MEGCEMDFSAWIWFPGPKKHSLRVGRSGISVLAKTRFWVLEARSLGLPDHRSSHNMTFVCGVMSCLTCLADDLKQSDSTAVGAEGTETHWRV